MSTMLEVSPIPGASCRIMPDLLAGDAKQCLVAQSAGVGDKAAVAYLAWREGFPPELWETLALDALALAFDECGCVGALGPFMVTATIARNSKRIPWEILARVAAGLQRACDLLSARGIPCHLTLVEDAEAGDAVRTMAVASTVTVRMPRDRVIDAGRMVPGDVIVGFATTGQSAWEALPNSGIGSTAPAQARHHLLGHDYRRRFPETFAPESDDAQIYRGALKLNDALPGDANFTIAAALLSPTRLYLPLIKRLLDSLPRIDLHGLVHCAVGGQTRILGLGGRGRRNGNRYVKDTLFALPPVLEALKEATGQSWAEMYAHCDMGHRLEAVVPPNLVDLCLAAAREARIDAQVVGRVESRDTPGNEVVIRTRHGEFKYR